MKKTVFLSLASAGLALVSTVDGGPYAGAVVSYNPGTGYLPGYINTAAVLGQPSAVNPYGDPVNPFDPAYDTNQILSIGAGGWVTVEFDRPILHYPNSSLDFIIFGDSFFNVTNFDDPFDLRITDGKVVNNGGLTRVSVSRDGVTFYALNPALAPTADSLYPTDGAGNFQRPVNPSLTPASFAGLTPEQVRVLYNGSAGGASYNIEWAQDTNGNPVRLPDIRYVRVDVLANQAQIAGFAAIAGTVLVENFSNCPAADGWKTIGDTNLFSWNAANENLQVTWDSTQSNSYFYHPLGTVLTSNDDFSLTFDLQLSQAGTNVDGSYQFELAIGLLNLAEAENANFLRGTGDNATNIAEFDYFPADAHPYGPAPDCSVDATLLDTKGDYFFCYEDLPLVNGTVYHVILNHAAGTSALTGEILTNGAIYTSLPQIFTEGTVGDFRLDAVAIMSYSDEGGYGESILAQGTVKNFLVTAPPPPVTYLQCAWSNNTCQVQFWSRANWNYTLEQSADLRSWSAAAPAVSGPGGLLTLAATNAPPSGRFYRVSANPE